MKTYYVYILASRYNGTLYVGITSDLDRRIFEHKAKILAGFTAEYNVDTLVYYEKYSFVTAAIKREKQMKRWRRAWKIELIQKLNPKWEDLWGEMY